jgi:hypothetical protein
MGADIEAMDGILIDRKRHAYGWMVCVCVCVRVSGCSSVVWAYMCVVGACVCVLSKSNGKYFVFEKENSFKVTQMCV